MSVVSGVPIVGTAGSMFLGSYLWLTTQPDLSQKPQYHTVYLTKNNIRVLYDELLPPNIRHLCCKCNLLGSDGLPPRFPDTLETLNLEYNTISDCDNVQHWSDALHELSLDDNPITSIPSTLPRRLNFLSIQYCKVKLLDHLPPGLKRLRAAYNQISKIKERWPQEMIYINLGHNSLSSNAAFRFPLPTTLVYLNLHSNDLTFLPQQLPDSLEYLIVSANKLTTLPSKLPDNLKLLVANSNKLLHFTPIKKPLRYSAYLRDNCLTEQLDSLVHRGFLDDIHTADNWNEPWHHSFARTIQRKFRAFRTMKRVRQYAAQNRIREELIMTAMHPLLIGRFDEIDTLKHFT